MEASRIAAAQTPDSESGISAVIKDSEVDSFMVNSSLDNVETSERRMLKNLKVDSIVGGQNTLDEVSVTSPLIKQNNGIELNNGGGDLYPITPSPDREPLEILSASDQTDDFEALSECETPTGSLFDPFAPGPEELALAPKKKDVLRELKIPTRRQLNFDILSDSEEKDESTVSDEESNLFESICKSFLELVVSNQLEEICSRAMVEGVNLSDDTSDGFKTPTSVPLLTGIAETCPDAPKRPPNYKARKLDHSLCRKLEFENYLI